MDKRDIDRIRNPGFTVARRGYDAREVDKFLRDLSEWLETDAAEELGSFAVKHKLELAGQTTSQILLTTEAECQEMLKRAESDSAKAVSDAKASARETRRLAEEEATRQREEAEEEARKTTQDANARAKHMVEEAEAKRDEIEADAGTTRAEAEEHSRHTRAAADVYAGDTRRAADEDAAEKTKQASAKARRMIKEGEERRQAIETLIADLRAKRDAAIQALEALSSDMGSVTAAHRPAKGREPFAKPAKLDPAERDSGRRGESAERARA
jgi:DivIVA domain-containing protein